MRILIEINQISLKLKELEKRIADLENNTSVKPIGTTKKISVREFLMEGKPKGDVQKTLAIGYYLETVNNFPCFNLKDIRACFKKAKEVVPSNINYKIIKNIEKGLIVECDDKKEGIKAWTLTQSGINSVENNFETKIAKDDIDFKKTENEIIENPDIDLDEFRRRYKFVDQQQKLIITALWLTKMKNIKELNSARINKALDENGFKKLDHITRHIERLRNKGMITITSGSTGKRKIFKLTREDMEEIERNYKQN